MQNLSLLRQKAWSPYICGIIIGLLQVPLYFYLKTTLGTSSSFGAVTCFLDSLFNPTPSNPICLPTLKPLLQIGVVLGIFMGAWVSASLSHSRRHGVPIVWKKLLGPNYLFKRFVLAFFGGFFLLLGARLANGCTSGNGISGMALLSVGSYLVIISMFISGIIISAFYKKV